MNDLHAFNLTYCDHDRIIFKQYLNGLFCGK